VPVCSDSASTPCDAEATTMASGCVAHTRALGSAAALANSPQHASCHRSTGVHSKQHLSCETRDSSASAGTRTGRAGTTSARQWHVPWRPARDERTRHLGDRACGAQPRAAACLQRPHGRVA
jgi:hypothetical protein